MVQHADIDHTGITGVGGGGAAELPIDAAATASVGSGDLFTGTSLDGGWSDLQSTPVTSKDRSVDGYLILKNTSNTGGQDRGIDRSFSPAGDFTVYTKINYATLGENFQWAGLFVGEADPGDDAGEDRLDLFVLHNSGIFLKFAKYAAGAETSVFAVNVTDASIGLRDGMAQWPLWLRIKRVGSTLTAGWSLDGVQFIDHATTTTIAFTVASCGLLIAEATSTRDIRAVYQYIATTG